MLSNCNTLSNTRLERAMRDFKTHTVHVMEMKKDVESVLKRIKNLKQKIAVQNPEAFKGKKLAVYLKRFGVSMFKSQS